MARSGAIEIPIAVDTGGVEKSIQNGLIDPVEDAHEAFEKLGETDAGRDLERQIERAQDATEELDDELDTTRKSLDKLGWAAKDAGDDAKKGFERAADGAKEIGTEAESTAKEAAASFTGSAEDIGDAFQELAANAFAGFGPAGAVAGIAAAAGLGMLLERWRQDAEEMEEITASMYDDMLESGNRYLSADFIQKGIGQITGDVDKYNQALQISKDLNVDVSDVIRAMAGDQTAVNSIIDETNDKRQEEIDAIKESGDSLENQSIKIDGVETKYAELTDTFYNLADAEDSAATRATAAHDATTAFLMDAIRDAGTATEEVDEFGNRLYTLPTGQKVLIDAETGQATTDISNFKGDLDGNVPTVKTTTIKVNVDDSAWRRWEPNPKTGRVNARVNQVV
ncbi:hypothetical protein [Microbacterium invictum]|uniref:Uncharacterized protein n=1 Tax=Microbacterium invictum TaxID=515415 RepID=A0ABZ0VEY8_9MICO|nr:hypothetical protein [Microbacterium invictum]WQB71961.1 hypothetical protein T9R20_08460 [Microbacterium invictum]